ncbi:MAG: glycoside hydrolase family 1 protein [Candidatus Zixiibacteriota bacterium]
MVNDKWKNEKLSKRFPHGFLWGSATSAYQVEGGNKNSDWEYWRVKAGKACDHYHRFEEDFTLAKSLNQNAHRFSIEWARIEPEKGEFNKKEVEHYRQVLQALQRRKIKPLVTLHHFTNPLWVAERGGWENPSTVGYFESYVRYIVTQLADLCNFWVTINEPWVYLSESYLYRRWPPEKCNPLAAFKVGKHMLRAHQGAYQLIHTIQPKAKVGIAYSLACVRTPININPLPWWERTCINWAKVQDFIGVNYYRSVHPLGAAGLPKNDIGWEIYPEGLYLILKDLKKFNLPIYITENGIADAKDEKRANFISDHLVSIWRALREGVDVRGYFYWSLLDNFEWARGFDPRFGLIEVDYKTMERIIRPSAKVYARIAKRNALD